MGEAVPKIRVLLADDHPIVLEGMMQELNLKTTADLIKFAIKHGIVSM